MSAFPASFRSLVVLALPVVAAVTGALLVPDDAKAGAAGAIAADSLPVARPNDNRAPAGRLANGVLSLDLVVRKARWYPDGDKRSALEIEAFGEAGKSLTVPAPLVRVTAGTIIEATVRNELPDSTITVFGLHTRPSAPDSFRVAPGASHRVRFAAGVPGTYLYYAKTMETGNLVSVADRDHERETAAGAFVVDDGRGRTDDRIFVINIWGEEIDSIRYKNGLAINGRSWPHSERITATTGDSLRWRIVNASVRGHPMHLHGFYFRVDGTGNTGGYTPLHGDNRKLVVTETMPERTTMDIVWSPDRPGNWLFHCHLAFHVVPEAAVVDISPEAVNHALSHNADEHMVGLILGINVKAAPGWREPPRTGARTMRLFVNEGARRGRSPRTMSYVLQRDGREPAHDSLEVAKSVLVVNRDTPTDIVVINRLKQSTGVHWHGIELESYSDGVVGWSGSEGKIAPAIAPGDSFVARLTLPRAGTFMYHTHLGDLVQLTSGLYGAMIVLDKGKVWDPTTDHVFVAGWDGGLEGLPRILINGDSTPSPLELAAGKTHRLRFVSIGAAPPMRFVLRRDTTIVSWRALAKDGADLPASRQVVQRAVQPLNVGETFDAEITPEPGEYRLAVEVRFEGRPIIPWQRRIVVK